MIKGIFNSLVNNGILSNRLEEAVNIIQGLVFTEISLDSISKSIVMEFLNETCKVYSLGSGGIVSQWRDVKSEGNNDIVFFKVPRNPPNVYFYKGCPIYALDRRHTGKAQIYFLKGTINLNTLLTEAREYTRPKTNIDEEEVNYYNFNIIEHTGAHGIVGNSNRPSNNDPEPEDCVSESNSIIYKTDIPLNYTLKDLDVKIRKQDPFDDLYFPKNVHDLVDDTKEWLKRRDWFIARGLPWRRGILIYGPGGTGKSSFAKSLGKKFGLPVNHMYLSNMTDYDFKQAWESAVAQTPCIVLLEDFDAVFNKRVAVNPLSKLNFDTILNTISGVKDSSGIILIITTNKIECIDEAIGVNVNNDGLSTRPGRIDKILYLGAMDDDNRQKLISKILCDWPDLIQLAFEKTKGYTPAQVQEVCIQYALQKLHEEK